MTADCLTAAALGVLSTQLCGRQRKGQGSQKEGGGRDGSAECPTLLTRSRKKKKKGLIKAPSLSRLIPQLLIPAPFSRPRTFDKRIIKL